MNDADTYNSFMLDHAAGTLLPSMHLAATIHRLMSAEGDAADKVWSIVRDALGPPETCELSKRAQSEEALALDIMDTDYDSLRWRRGLSGARHAALDGTGGSLMRLKPEDRVFSHGHSTLEVMVVLDGALEDGRGKFETGDIVLATPDVRHRPMASGNKSCTCFVARRDTSFWRLT